MRYAILKHSSTSFQQEISDCLGRDRSVLQLTIDMTEYMSEIHNAIVQCMSTTLSELKRSNTTVSCNSMSFVQRIELSFQLDLDDLNVENAYFKSFDILVRRQLDSVWHKVGPRTKQLVSDLATLRRLLRWAVHSFDFCLLKSSSACFSRTMRSRSNNI